MSNVHELPGANLATRTGQPRPDMAKMLRRLADRADAGEFDTLAVAATFTDGGETLTGLSTPENDLFRLVGCLESLKLEILSRDRADRAGYMTCGWNAEEPA